ncbi:MAG: sulfatase-like hydrolase/transferase [Planctomycetota bacterium]
MKTRPVHAAALLATLLVACGEKPGERVSGILITLDTTNRPALGCYGGRGSTTPNLDALARESLVYDQARAVAPITFPSHTSMLTGLYPIRHRIRDNGLRPLSPDARTLAEAARDEGYQTAAFVSCLPLSSPFGLTQGFDRYEEPVEKRMLAAKETTESVIAWLKQLDRERPFFLWVHYYDPHAPYQPEQRYLDQVSADGEAKFPDYLGEIAQMDASIGDLMSHLRASGFLDRSFLAVVADHGEGLGRHGELSHCFLTYDTVIRVPMFFRYPDGYRAGERSDEFVTVADIFPTFVRGLGLGDAGDVDGLDLYRTEAPTGRGVYFESYAGYLGCGWSPLACWADPRGTYFHGTEPELFAPEDENQVRNIVALEGALARSLRAEIGRIADRPRIGVGTGTLDDELKSRIRELGYLAQGDSAEEAPHPLAETGLPSPQRHIAEINPYQTATTLLLDGKVDEAMAVLQEMVRQTPNNTLATELLGNLFIRKGDNESAVALLKKTLELRPEQLTAVGLLAVALVNLSRHQEALDTYLAGYERWPTDQRFQDGVVEQLEALGRHEDAQLFRKKFKP